MDKDALKTTSAIAGMVFGVVGIIVAVVNVRSEAARLDISVESVGWSSPGGAEVIDTLESIEVEYGQATGGLVNDLKRVATGIDDWSSPGSLTSDLENILRLPEDEVTRLLEDKVLSVRDFEASLGRAILRLQNSDQYDWSDLKVTSDFVTWPRGEKLYFGSVSSQDLSAELVERARRDRLGSEDLEDLQKEALPLLRGEDTPEHGRDEKLAYRDLRRLRSRIEEVTDPKKRRVRVVINILNQSRLPNNLLANAVLVAKEDVGASRVVPLRLVGPASIGRLASATVVFESEVAGSIGTIAQGLREGQKCAIAFGDIRGESWSAVGSFAVEVLPASNKELEELAKEELVE